MKPYNSYSYIYPPRPEYKILPDSLDKYDTGEYIAQAKFNGSCCELFMDGVSKTMIKNRHNGTLTLFKLSEEEMKSVYRGKGHMVLVGEYMNKNQNDENEKSWNHKFVIFDILVYNSEYLVGTTYTERYNLLKEIYETKPYSDYADQITDNIFMVKNYENNFKTIWERITKIGMLEGLVLKKREGKLERGTREKNNMGWQCKARKPNPNYTF